MIAPRRHVIVTLSDERCGDFLVEHWAASLQANVNLQDVDVVVLDYGLSSRQREALQAIGVECYPCVKDGFVGCCCIRDMAKFLSERNYDQVLHIDGGDVIFQSDCHSLLSEHCDQFRVVFDEIDTSCHDLLLPSGDLEPGVLDTIHSALRDKPNINTGLILAPSPKMIDLCRRSLALLQRLQYIYSDQLALNYILYQDGFVHLDGRYNFIPVTTRQKYRIRNGVFLDADDRVIPIVHNAGRYAWARVITRFGYGPDRNRRKWLIPSLMRAGFLVLDFVKRRVFRR